MIEIALGVLLALVIFQFLPNILAALAFGIVVGVAVYFLGFWGLVVAVVTVLGGLGVATAYFQWRLTKDLTGQPQGHSAVKASGHNKKWVVLVALVGVMALLGFSIYKRADLHQALDQSVANSPPPEPAYVGCTVRGIDYMKEIGSYPTMKGPPNEGKSALKYIEERCRRTTAAY